MLIKEDNTKRVNFPLDIVQSLNSNELGEVTTVMVKNSKIGEKGVKVVLFHYIPQIRFCYLISYCGTNIYI